MAAPGGNSARDDPFGVVAATDRFGVALARAGQHYGFAAADAAALLTQIPFAAGEADVSGIPDEGLIESLLQPTGLAIMNFIDAAPERAWSKLTRPLRRLAKSWARYLWSDRRMKRRGRPVEINPPLIMFLILMIERIINSPFPMSRPPGNNEKTRAPTGPAFELLTAALDLERLKCAAAGSGGTRRPTDETIYSLVVRSRSQAFRDALAGQGLSWSVESLVGHPNLFTFLLSRSEADR